MIGTDNIKNTTQVWKICLRNGESHTKTQSEVVVVLHPLCSVSGCTDLLFCSLPGWLLSSAGCSWTARTSDVRWRRTQGSLLGAGGGSRCVREEFNCNL